MELAADKLPTMRPTSEMKRLVEQGQIHGISRSSSLFLPAERKRFRRTDTPSYRVVCSRLKILWDQNLAYDAVLDQGQFGLHLLFCHKNSHWRSLNDYILIKKVKAVLETNGKQFMGSNWQFIWFLFERNGENKSKMVVKKVTNEI